MTAIAEPGGRAAGREDFLVLDRVSQHFDRVLSVGAAIEYPGILAAAALHLRTKFLRGQVVDRPIF